MPRITVDQAVAQREAILAAAESIVIERGWEGLTVRAVEAAADVSRTVVSDDFRGVELKNALVTTAFDHLRSIATKADRDQRVHVTTLRDRILDLFRQSPQAAALMARCCADVRVTAGPSVRVSLHFFEERTSAVDHIVQSCGLPERAVEPLVDWYIAAATVLQTTSIAKIDDLPAIGRFDPGRID